MRIDQPIRSRRLCLKTLHEDMDHSQYAGWLRDAEVNRYLEVRFDPPDASRLSQFISNVNRSQNELLLGIHVGSDQHIGNIKIGPIEREHRRATIGIVIGEKDHWGKGFATEAIETAADYAFNHLEVDILFAGSYETNPGSLAAFTKAGFSQYGKIENYWLADEGRVGQILLGKECPNAPAC